MLTPDLIEQVTTLFKTLENKITLLHSPSAHGDQSTLLELLMGLTQTSNKITVESTDHLHTLPHFEILKNGQKTGIQFTGVPGGHEFSSLILAILNADGKGRLPDPVISNRIRSIKGPVHLKTYISLSCENCPDVVQALNQMTLIHENFTHEMIDGALAQSEIETLGIQGVPSVIHEGKLLHSGKIEFLDLLTKLESHFGKSETTPLKTHLGEFDVVVIGSGPAGASAAIYSARKGLKTAMVYDRIGGQVRDTKGIENLISVPYTEGPILASKFQEHLSQYSIQTFEHRRVKTLTHDLIKTIELESGESLTAHKIIVATGAKWRELNIPGEKDYLGQGVAFCPHCDGPFYTGKSVAVIGGGNSGVEAAIDLAGIVKDVTLFEYAPQLKADQVLIDKLKSLPNTRIITNAQTKEVVGDGKKVTHLKYIDRTNGNETLFTVDGIFVQIGLLPNSQFLKETVELNRMGEIVIDAKNRTSAPGIYAAGDVTTIPYKQIVISMGEGAKAALSAFEDRMLGA